MLKDKQLLQLRSIAQECHDLKEINDIREFIQTRIRNIFSHEIAVCGTCDLSNHHVVRLINIDFPKDYLQSVVQSDQVIRSHTFRMWVGRQTPVFYRDGEINRVVESKWLNTIRRCGIHSIASHGIIDLNSQYSSYFAFGNVYASDFNEINSSLITLIPYLHYSLSRILTMSHSIPTNETNCLDSAPHRSGKLHETAENVSLLSARELEILGWVSVGKSNWEIAQILGISQFTVNNHIKSLFKKLFVTNRTQAVTKALALSLISMQ